MNLVLISGSTPDSHDPRGGQWIIQSWGLVMIQEDRSAVRSAFGWSSRRYWLHIHLCNWHEACIMIQLDFRPNWACETGSSSGRAWSPGGLQALEPKEIIPANMLPFLFSENGRWNESHLCPYLPSQQHLPLNQGQRWFGGTRNDSHIIPSWCVCCLPSWYEGRTSPSWVSS